MKAQSLLVVTLVLAVGCAADKPAAPSPAKQFDGIRLQAKDGTTVYARLVPAKGASKGVVLMFHQAGSNMHEYDPISERVSALGWDCLKVDQRAGGEMWGEANLTAAQFGDKESYESAYQDMEAALAWAESEKYDKVLAWGSSYSASLALRLATEHASVDAVLSFSPGEYFGGGEVVKGWAGSVKVPCFFATTMEEFVGGAREIIEAHQATPAGKMDVAYGWRDGIHGSSTLRNDRNEAGAERYWGQVEKFLRQTDSGEQAAPPSP